MGGIGTSAALPNPVVALSGVGLPYSRRQPTSSNMLSWNANFFHFVPQARPMEH
jgi:hypothetical protein